MMLRPFVSRLLLVLMAAIGLGMGGGLVQAEPLKIATFAIDASPPVGSPMAYDLTKGVQDPLTFKGVLLQSGQDKTLVLCAVDWIGISSATQDAFKQAIAQAVNTKPEMVVIHALHQHDAPRADATTLAVLEEFDLPNQSFIPELDAKVAVEAAAAAKKATESWQTVTHIGLGEGKIEKVASNRRILGPDGKVKYVRYTATKDPVIREQPTGTIDPMCKLISFWNEDRPLAVLTYYATHPQSYYRTGLANPDFPGMARNARQEETGTFHVHFNGAGGNIGAGKWNDGAKENRQILADRVSEGMRKAWENIKKHPVQAKDVAWETVPVKLPAAPHLNAETLTDVLKNPKSTPQEQLAAATNLAWLRRCQAEDTIDIACLTLGPARVLHMPGELFVEYQLAAQQMRPDLFVAMAAYGDYAPGYIGTEVAYGEGGYETSPRASRVSPRVESVLLEAMEKLLKAPK